jgi:hypothetical protein
LAGENFPRHPKVLTSFNVEKKTTKTEYTKVEDRDLKNFKFETRASSESGFQSAGFARSLFFLTFEIIFTTFTS